MSYLKEEDYYSKPRIDIQERLDQIKKGTKVGNLRDPGDINFRSMLQDGQLPERMQANMDPRALERMRSVAYGGAGLNRPFKEMLAQSGKDLASDIGTATTMAGTGAAQATSNIAQTSGVTSGAQERIKRASDRNLMMQKQQQRAGAADRNLGILQLKEDVQRQAQEALPGMELKKLSVDEFNLKNRLSEKRRQDQLQNRKFGTQMEEYGAQQSAGAYGIQPERGLLDKLTGGLI